MKLVPIGKTGWTGVIRQGLPLPRVTLAVRIIDENAPPKNPENHQIIWTAVKQDNRILSSTHCDKHGRCAISFTVKRPGYSRIQAKLKDTNLVVEFTVAFAKNVTSHIEFNDGESGIPLFGTLAGTLTITVDGEHGRLRGLPLVLTTSEQTQIVPIREGVHCIPVKDTFETQTDENGTVTFSLMNEGAKRIELGVTIANERKTFDIPVMVAAGTEPKTALPSYNPNPQSVSQDGEDTIDSPQMAGKADGRHAPNHEEDTQRLSFGEEEQMSGPPKHGYAVIQNSDATGRAPIKPPTSSTEMAGSLEDESSFGEEEVDSFFENGAQETIETMVGRGELKYAKKRHRFLWKAGVPKQNNLRKVRAPFILILTATLMIPIMLGIMFGPGVFKRLSERFTTPTVMTQDDTGAAKPMSRAPDSVEKNTDGEDTEHQDGNTTSEFKTKREHTAADRASVNTGPVNCESSYLLWINGVEYLLRSDCDNGKTYRCLNAQSTDPRAYRNCEDFKAPARNPKCAFGNWNGPDETGTVWARLVNCDDGYERLCAYTDENFDQATGKFNKCMLHTPEQAE